MPQQITVPRTNAELKALVARKDAIEEQLQSLTERRGRLAQERLNAEARAQTGMGSGTQDRRMASELTAQIDQLGARSKQLEADLTKAEDAITAARSSGISEDNNAADLVRQVISIPPPRVDVEVGSRLAAKYQVLMLGEALMFVLVGIVAVRLTWRAAMRKVGQLAGTGPAVTDLRQSIDAIAIEVERISENQRYVTKMLTEGRAPAEKIQVAEKEGQRRA